MSALAVVFAVVLSAPEGVKFFEGTFEDALKGAAKAKKLVFVSFHG